MQVIKYSESENPILWQEQIRQADWRAAQYLYQLLQEKKLKEQYGEKTELLLLTEGDTLIAFCTLAEQDEIRDPSLTPWVGFVYTFPEYRGRKRMGKLLEYAYLLAKKEGYGTLYVSSEEEGLYEKYGFTFWKKMKTIWGEQTQVFRLPIVEMNYTDVIGKTVKGTIDRPLGSAHPNHPDMIHPSKEKDCALFRKEGKYGIEKDRRQASLNSLR